VLDASAHPARVLLLHGGTGTVEREILRDGRVQGLTVVVDDAELVRLTHRMNWLSSRAHGALDAPRVALVVAEPATWLGAHAEEVDAIVDDLPFPTGHREGKYYTRYYLGLLSKHLAAGGAWVVPAASAFTASTAFSSVLATAGSVGVRASAYHTAIPSLGVTSFVVGSRDAPTRELVATQGVAFDLGKDLGRQTPGEISTLHDQRVVTAFETAREATEGPRSGE
jgi:spermidine synthase